MPYSALRFLFEVLSTSQYGDLHLGQVTGFTVFLGTQLCWHLVQVKFGSFMSYTIYLCDILVKSILAGEWATPTSAGYTLFGVLDSSLSSIFPYSALF